MSTVTRKKSIVSNLNVAYSLTLECSVCCGSVTLSGTDTRSDPYVAKKLGQKPEVHKPKIQWKFCRERQTKLREARKFVKDNPTVPAFQPGYCPEFVKFMPHGFPLPVHFETGIELVETRHVDCPLCGGKVYLDSRIKTRELYESK